MALEKKFENLSEEEKQKELAILWNRIYGLDDQNELLAYGFFPQDSILDEGVKFDSLRLKNRYLVKQPKDFLSCYYEDLQRELDYLITKPLFGRALELYNSLKLLIPKSPLHKLVYAEKGEFVIHIEDVLAYAEIRPGQTSSPRHAAWSAYCSLAEQELDIYTSFKKKNPVSRKPQIKKTRPKVKKKS